MPVQSNEGLLPGRATYLTPQPDLRPPPLSAHSLPAARLRIISGVSCCSVARYRSFVNPHTQYRECLTLQTTDVFISISAMGSCDVTECNNRAIRPHTGKLSIHRQRWMISAPISEPERNNRSAGRTQVHTYICYQVGMHGYGCSVHTDAPCGGD